MKKLGIKLVVTGLLIAMLTVTGCGDSKEENVELMDIVTEVSEKETETSDETEEVVEETTTEQESEVAQEESKSEDNIHIEDGFEEIEEGPIVYEGNLEDDPTELGDVFSVEDTMKLVEEYGFEEENSRLEFVVYRSTAKKMEDYFEVEVAMYCPIKVPADMQPGDTVEVTYDYVKGITKTVECTGESEYMLDDLDCYSFNMTDDGMKILYCMSDDMVTAFLAGGTIKVRRDAIAGYGYSTEEIPYVSRGIFDKSKDWYMVDFNAVSFDEDGRAYRLLYFGD